MLLGERSWGAGIPFPQLQLLPAPCRLVFSKDILLSSLLAQTKGILTALQNGPRNSSKGLHLVPFLSAGGTHWTSRAFFRTGDCPSGFWAPHQSRAMGVHQNYQHGVSTCAVEGWHSYKAYDNKQNDRRWISNTVYSPNTTGRFRNQCKTGIFTNLWKLNNTLLTNGSEITKKIRKYLEMNENPNISYQNLCHKVKAVLEGHW